MKDDNIIYINENKIKIEDWSLSILQICELINISIPRFCYHSQSSIAGNCRMCMVEIKNSIKPIIACATSLNKNMMIFTNSELVKIARENVLELLLINHPLDCPICDQGGECDLQDQTIIYGSDRGRFKEIKRSVEDKEFGPIIKTIMTRCIHCTRCIRFAEEIAGISILGTMGRGKNTEIGTYIFNTFKSEISGNIIDLCPVGASTNKPYAFKARPWELISFEHIDILDSLGSWIRIDVKGDEIMRILPRKNDRLNKEWISDKIRFFYEGARINRLLFPLYNKKGKIINCSWSFAIQLIYNYHKFSLNSKYLLGAYLSGNINKIESEYFFEFCNLYNIKNYYIPKNINMISDLRNEWCLNTTIDDFLQSDQLFFTNLNLKYECSVLQAQLFQSLYNQNNVIIYYLGNYQNFNYEINHIGFSDYLNQLIKEGKNYLCFFLKNKITRLVINDNINYFGYKQLNLNFLKFSSIATNSSEINNLENGIKKYNNINFNSKYKYFLLYLCGDFQFNILNEIDSNYIIFIGHHYPEKLINKINLCLPITCFYEQSGDWLNNQLIINSIYDQVTSIPGNIFQFNKILKTINLFLKNKNLIKSNYLDFIKFNNINIINNELINNYEIINFMWKLFEFHLGLKHDSVFFFSHDLIINNYWNYLIENDDNYMVNNINYILHIPNESILNNQINILENQIDEELNDNIINFFRVINGFKSNYDELLFNQVKKLFYINFKKWLKNNNDCKYFYNWEKIIFKNCKELFEKEKNNKLISIKNYKYKKEWFELFYETLEGKKLLKKFYLEYNKKPFSYNDFKILENWYHDLINNIYKTEEDFYFFWYFFYLFNKLISFLYLINKFLDINNINYNICYSNNLKIKYNILNKSYFSWYNYDYDNYYNNNDSFILNSVTLQTILEEKKKENILNLL